MSMTDGTRTAGTVTPSDNNHTFERLATGLGLFSIGLGVAELLAPRHVARLAGLKQPDERADSLVRAFGAREIASGLAILARPSSAAPVWARVAGDALDLYSLRAAASTRDVDQPIADIASASLLAVAALDVYVAQGLGERTNGELVRAPQSRAVRVHDVVTINAPIAEVYQFWRQFAFAPQMRHVHSGRVLDDRRSRWQVRLPGGKELEWDAIISEEVPDSRIAWRSQPDAPVLHAGTVMFAPAPGGRGTELRVGFTYEPPGGRLGSLAAWLGNGLLESQIREDLRRCKQVIESGEVLVSDGPALWRAAQPAGDADDARIAAGVER